MSPPTSVTQSPCSRLRNVGLVEYSAITGLLIVLTICRYPGRSDATPFATSSSRNGTAFFSSHQYPFWCISSPLLWMRVSQSACLPQGVSVMWTLLKKLRLPWTRLPQRPKRSTVDFWLIFNAFLSMELFSVGKRTNTLLSTLPRSMYIRRYGPRNGHEQRQRPASSSSTTAGIPCLPPNALVVYFLSDNDTSLFNKQELWQASA